MLQAYILIVSGIVGLAVGSFLNVVIHRLPRMILRVDPGANQTHQNNPGRQPDDASQPDGPAPYHLAFPASHCPHCETPLKARHNIPVVSYLALRGRCSQCKAPISRQYPLVEALSGLLSVLVVAQFGVTLAGLLALVFTWFLLAMAAIDWKTLLLPDSLTLPLLWLGLIASTQSVFVPPETAIMGAVVGYLSLWLLTQAFWVCTGRVGMGHGDFKLFAALGAWVGWAPLYTIVMAAGVMSLLAAALCWATHRVARELTPFGPFLAVAGWAFLVFGGHLPQWPASG